MRSYRVLLCAVVLALATVDAGQRTAHDVGTNAARSGSARPVPASAGERLTHHEFALPPNAAQCQAEVAVACYTPRQLQRAYDLEPLYRQGLTGSGRTIAIVDPFGSPTIGRDLQTFDRRFGIPDPPSVTTITPAGQPPPFDAGNPDMAGWAYETTLDVEYAHAIAPGARILVVATPVSETEGVAGFPEIVTAEKYVVEHDLADVISQSFAAAEDSFPSRSSVLGLRGAFVAAAAHRVSVLAAAGDTGVAAYRLGEPGLSSEPVDSWPPSDPLVTSVGGTHLHLDRDGDRRAPDTVWHDAYGAGGGGRSDLFARPAFQEGVRNVVGDARGTPDVAMSAAVDGGVVVYTSYDAADTGWSVVGGTSESAPLFAGVVAIADQMAHRRLGDLNPDLYRLAGEPDNGLVDVWSGDNSFGGVPGYDAEPGYDLASGLGTIDAARFVPALAHLAARQHPPSS